MPPKYFDPFSLAIDLESGAMLNPTRTLVRRAADMRGYYANPAALEELIRARDNPVHYEVSEVPVPEQPGHLMYCISKLLPGRVGDECFMTKGHYHTVAATAEVYLCLRGEGYTVLKTPEGRPAVQKMSRGQMVYVPPLWGHRSVNTSATEPLITFCVYPAEAGHNYGDIASEGFPVRIFDRGGRIVVEGLSK